MPPRRTTLTDRTKAARAYQTVTDIRHEMAKQWQHLAAIHSAPQWLWSALVASIVGTGKARSQCLSTILGQYVRNGMQQYQVLGSEFAMMCCQC
jgi:hypothetical protein